MINSCSCKEDFIKRKVDEIMNFNKSKAKDLNTSGNNSNDSGWKVVDKGGKFRNGKNFSYFLNIKLIHFLDKLF